MRESIVLIFITSWFRFASDVTMDFGTLTHVQKDTTPKLVFGPISGKFKAKLGIYIGKGKNELASGRGSEGGGGR